MYRTIILLIPVSLLVACSWAAGSGRAPAEQSAWSGENEPVHVDATPVALEPGDPDADIAGRLRFRSGFQLTAEHEKFGGLSGLEIDGDGRWLTAISDRGYWWVAELRHDARGTLAGFGDAYLGPLLELDGQPMKGSKEGRDAEEIVTLSAGRYLVTFECQHRILVYPAGGRPAPAPGGVPQSLPCPALDPIDSNAGMEAAALLAGGRVVILAEDFRTPDGLIVGWIGGPDFQWQQLTMRPTEPYLPTAAATLPDGDVVLLERYYSPETDNLIRLSRIRASTITPGAELVTEEMARLRQPQTVDNMEGIAARRGPRGETLIYILSDDNFNQNQRTLLMQFELMPDSIARDSSP